MTNKIVFLDSSYIVEDTNSMPLHLCFFGKGECLKIYNNHKPEEVEEKLNEHLNNRTDVEKHREGNEAYVVTLFIDPVKGSAELSTNFGELAQMLSMDFFNNLNK